MIDKRRMLINDVLIFIVISIFMIVLTILRCISLVSAQNYTVTTCLDNITLQVNSTFSIVVNGNTTNVETTENVYCQFGCNIDKCNETFYKTTFSMNLELFVILISIFVVFILIGYKFNAPIFSIMGSFFSLIIGIIMVTTGFTINNLYYQDNYTLMLGIFFIGMFIYVLAGEAFG